MNDFFYIYTTSKDVNYTPSANHAELLKIFVERLNKIEYKISKGDKGDFARDFNDNITEAELKRCKESYVNLLQTVMNMKFDLLDKANTSYTNKLSLATHMLARINKIKKIEQQSDKKDERFLTRLKYVAGMIHDRAEEAQNQR